MLFKLFSRGIWKRLHDLLDADGDGIVTSDEIKLLDTDGDNKLSKSELRAAIANLLGLSTVDGEDVGLPEDLEDILHTSSTHLTHILHTSSCDKTDCERKFEHTTQYIVMIKRACWLR